MTPSTPPGASRSTRKAIAQQRAIQRDYLYNLYVKPFINKLPQSPSAPLIIQYPFDYTDEQIRHQWRKHFTKEAPELWGRYRLSFRSNESGWVLTITPKLPPPTSASPIILKSRPDMINEIFTIEATRREKANLIPNFTQGGLIAQGYDLSEQSLREYLSGRKPLPPLPSEHEEISEADIDAAIEAAQKKPSAMSKFGQPGGREAPPPKEEATDCPLNEDEQELLSLIEKGASK